MSYNNNTSDLYCMDVSEPDQNVPVEYESGTVVHAPEPSSNKRDGAAKRDLVKQRGEVQSGQVS